MRSKRLELQSFPGHGLNPPTHTVATVQLRARGYSLYQRRNLIGLKCAAANLYLTTSCKQIPSRSSKLSHKAELVDANTRT